VAELTVLLARTTSVRNMNINPFLEKWKAFVIKMNDKGIPLPMVRDPGTLEGSVSLTLVVISSMLVIIGIVGKWSGKLGGIDMDNAMQFLWTSCSLYWGRKIGSNKATKEDKNPIEDENK